MNKPCGCCEGIQKRTPAEVANRPGLSSLLYRAGKHASFLDTMKAALSSGPPSIQTLATREGGDPAIALLDAWATVADVLTFYQERIANEGYLRTAKERRSVVELARLIGYKPRPGVGSSVYLAFTLQKDFDTPIDAGTAAKTTPGPGEKPQTLETSKAIAARSVWNEIAPRRTRPQDINPQNANDIPVVWLAGTSTKLKPNDLLLIVLGDAKPIVRKVASIAEDHKNQRTKVTLQVEEFSATGFLQAMLKILQSWIAINPAVGKDQNIQALLALSKGSQNKLTDLDDVVAATAQKLSGADVQTSIDNLTKLSAFATGMAGDLTGFLNANEANLKAGVDPVLDRYQKQEGHASKVNTALLTFKNSAGDPVATRIQKLLAAQKSLTDEAVEDGEFKALAQAMKTLSSDLNGPIGDLNSKLETALGDAVTGIAKAAGLAAGDAGLVTSLNKIHDALAAQAGKSADAKQGALETASTGLAALDPADPAVKTEIGLVQDIITNSDADVTLSLKNMIQQVNGSDLLVKNQGPVTQVANQVASMRLHMSGPLLAQSKAIVDGMTAFQSLADNLPAGLLADRVQELLGAIPSASGNVVQQDVAAVVAARVLPGPMPANSIEDQRRGEIVDLLKPLGAAASVADIVQRTKDAAASLDSKNTTMLDDILGLKNQAATFKGVATDLTGLNDKYRAMWEDAMGLILTRYQERFKSLRQDQDAAKALTSLETLAPLQAGTQHASASVLAAIPLAASEPGTSALLSASQAELQQAASATGSLKVGLIGSVLGLLNSIASVIPAVQANVVAAKAALTDALSKSRLPLKKAGDAAQKVLDDLNKVTPAPGPVAEFFKDLKDDLDAKLAQLTGSAAGSAGGQTEQTSIALLGEVSQTLDRTSPAGIGRSASLASAFDQASNVVARTLVAMRPRLAGQLTAGWGARRVELPAAEVYAFRVKASLFGHTAPTNKKTVVNFPGETTETVEVQDADDPTPSVQANILELDGSFDQITPNSWVALQTPPVAQGAGAQPGAGDTVRTMRAGGVNSSVSLSKYGINGKGTEVSVTEPWFDTQPGFGVIRRTGVWAQSELLARAEEPIECPVGNYNATKFPDCPPPTPDQLELDGFFDDLAAGRAVVISGERTDVPGVVTSEVAQVIDVQQNINKNLPGDSLHTNLSLATPLQFGYTRGTVKINANVAQATHGETQKEVLGSGNGSQAFQRFKLHHLPLTYLPAPTPSGAASTLQVRVNDVLWHEADNLEFLNPSDRSYAIAIEDDGTTTVTFGDGIHGARLPSGVENIRAVYRSGLGAAGNVPAKQISVAPSPPLGVTGVTNPAAATGGADPETIEQARSNAPLAVKALDRLISVQDYADFARTYAGIVKANAVSEGGLVKVVVSGIDDIPIDLTSDLMINLGRSMRNFGDPHQPFTIAVRKLKLLVMSASVAIDPDYLWIKVEAQIRQALLYRFGYNQRDLGQDALLGVAISAMQQVAGVLYIKVDHFGSIDETANPQDVVDQVKTIVTAQGDASARISVKPDEIAYFVPSLKETLILSQITPEEGQ